MPLPPATSPPLSKSRYLAGRQCGLRLWYACYSPELASPPDAALQAIFDTGHRVGALARERFTGGRLVETDHRDPDAAIAATAALAAAGAVPAIFEAAFRHRGVLVRVDVLERLDGARWRINEVKSSTRRKDVFLEDVAVQAWVVAGAGVALAGAGLLLLDRSYVYDGVRLDVGSLFRFEDCTGEARERSAGIEEAVTAQHALLAAPAAPGIRPGPHCSEPYECPFLAHCTRDLARPEHPVDELPRLGDARRAALQALGIDEVDGVPGDFDLTPLQARVRRAVATRTEFVSPGLGPALATAVAPVHYLDFEAFNPAIPCYAGTRPYDAVPFQFSLHVDDGAGGARHTGYLHDGRDDPRRALAESLLGAVEARGSICVYSGYERRVIGELATLLPDLRAPLEALLERLWDLLPIVREHYYHPGFHGSFSLKRVLPALVPAAGYEDLDITEGTAAAHAYEGYRLSDDEGERRAIREALLAYCRRDTQAMRELVAALRMRAR